MMTALIKTVSKTFILTAIAFSILSCGGSGTDSNDRTGEEPPTTGGVGTQVIANWDVVPYQVITSNFKVGVVAFHESGVDVEFTVNGGPVTTVSAPSYNDRTDVYEYWIEINPANHSDGEMTISATANPDDLNNQARVLTDLILYTNANGTLQNYNGNSIVWADCDNGNDTAGDGSESNPFQTIERAYAQAGAGGTVYLEAGLNYTITNSLASANYSYWTNVTTAPGVSRDEVRILGGTNGRFGETMVKWNNVRFYIDEDPTGYFTLMQFADGQHLWFKNSEFYNERGHHTSTDLFNTQNAKYYMTGCLIRDIGVAAGYFQRNCEISNIGGDVWRAKDDMVIINTKVDNMDPMPGAHADLIQWYNPGSVVDNVILYNITATNINSQGFFGYSGENTAIVNVLVEKTADNARLSQVFDMNHILIWHSNFVNLDFSITDTSNVSNWNIQNSILNKLIPGDQNPTVTELDASFISNNHYVELNWNQTNGGLGNNYTTGDPFYINPTPYGSGYHTPGTENYHLQVTSPGYQQAAYLECVPADIEGDLRNVVSPSYGAYE
jgi:hypothetical protein